MISETQALMPINKLRTSSNKLLNVYSLLTFNLQNHSTQSKVVFPSDKLLRRTPNKYSMNRMENIEILPFRLLPMTSIQGHQQGYTHLRQKAKFNSRQNKQRQVYHLEGHLISMSRRRALYMRYTGRQSDNNKCKTKDLRCDRAVLEKKNQRLLSKKYDILYY